MRLLARTVNVVLQYSTAAGTERVEKKCRRDANRQKRARRRTTTWYWSSCATGPRPNESPGRCGTSGRRETTPGTSWSCTTRTTSPPPTRRPILSRVSRSNSSPFRKTSTSTSFLRTCPGTVRGGGGTTRRPRGSTSSNFTCWIRTSPGGGVASSFWTGAFERGATLRSIWPKSTPPTGCTLTRTGTPGTGGSCTPNSLASSGTTSPPTPMQSSN
mmetsp:Transcript_26745/g.56859  ORF Transcript_26745/g.56859 Transcript_26745/m.56859 type:complete len:215 (+) Transcript_26745:683-1327(+)